MAQRPTRRVRHWKQRYNPDAEFVWDRYVTVDGKQKKPGQRVDKKLFNHNKLRRLWVTRFISEKDWTPPVIHNPTSEPVEVERVGAVG